MNDGTLKKKVQKHSIAFCGYKIMKLPYSYRPSRKKLSQTKVRLHDRAGVKFQWAKMPFATLFYCKIDDSIAY